MIGQFSRYIGELTEFALKVKAKAVYCFVLDGDKGTGGCPLIIGTTDHAEYIARCRELIGMLRRSAAMLTADVARQGGERVPMGDDHYTELTKRLEAALDELAALKASIRSTPMTGQVDLHGMWSAAYARQRTAEAVLSDISDVCVQALMPHRTPGEAREAVQAIANVYDRWLARRP